MLILPILLLIPISTSAAAAVAPITTDIGTTSQTHRYHAEKYLTGKQPPFLNFLSKIFYHGKTNRAHSWTNALTTHTRNTERAPSRYQETPCAGTRRVRPVVNCESSTGGTVEWGALL